MDARGLTVVAVIDVDQEFAGVLDRNKLTSSIVADLVKQSVKNR
jgi:hypothetical protein